ncbi:MAG: hypothetical protein H6621_06715 [Halobacteriovoraceae bacterium]|nr:hypothetical protein [Halobacteriovoraceae bacterium]
MTLFKIIFLLFPIISFAQIKTQGEIGFESRVFKNDHDNVTESSNRALFTRFITKYKNKNLKAKARIIGRIDEVDSNRDFYNPEELWVGYDVEGSYLRFGYQLFNWSATEAFHPADFVNSRNYDSKIENAEKFGELMLSYKNIFGDNAIEVFYMPRFEEPNLPDTTSPMRFTSIELDKGYILKDKQEVSENYWIPQGGIRFNTLLGDTDASLYYVNHINRSEFTFFVNKYGNISPLYVRTERMGFTTQSVLGNYLLKTEYAFLNYPDYLEESAIINIFKDHSEFAFGLERTESFTSGSEITFILEFQRYFGIDKSYLQTVLFQNDVLLGARYAFNDASSKEIFASIIADLDSEYKAQKLYNLAYSQRLGDSWILESGVRFVDAKLYQNYIGLEIIDNSDHIYLNLKKYF